MQTAVKNYYSRGHWLRQMSQIVREILSGIE